MISFDILRNLLNGLKKHHEFTCHLEKDVVRRLEKDGIRKESDIEYISYCNGVINACETILIFLEEHVNVEK
ncbi:hypothetical protein [Oceanobacillus polygoni]|uniref:Uncharacterized protein n=1 Tax=Oceanobacillus polygoni TaxID=1235259 RepID=A0A9X0YVS8_9BACI|nr:hypothetical protein [Oceanobacillus polygoni]MBP2079778.1 hypothetical protein [Oceanobacillus polygoni]